MGSGAAPSGRTRGAEPGGGAAPGGRNTERKRKPIPGEQPENRDLSRGLVGIVNVFYGVALGAFLFDGNGRQIVLSPGEWPTATAAVVVTVVALVWSYMGYAFHLQRFPYRVRWEPLGEGLSTADRKEEQKAVNATGWEDWRFAIDLAVPVGFGVMMLLAFGTEDGPEPLTGGRLVAFLGLLFLVRLLTQASVVLRCFQWRSHVLRRFRPRQVGGQEVERAPWGDLVSLALPAGVFLVAWIGDQTLGAEVWWYLVAAGAVVLVQIGLDRMLAKAEFERVGAPGARPAVGGLTAGAQVYVAGPLGFADSSRGHHVEVLAALSSAGLSPLDPWRHPPLPGAPGSRELHEATRRYGAQNAADVAAADAVLAILDGVDIDSGTAAEVGYARALGKPIVGLRTDLRRSGENDTVVVNLQVQWFVESSGGRIERSLDAAVAAVHEVLAGEPVASDRAESSP